MSTKVVKWKFLLCATYVTCSDVIVVDVHLVSCYVMLSNHLIIKEVNVDSEQSCKAGNFRF